MHAVGESEKTFTNYTPAQAAAYAAGRFSYPPNLYRLITDYHEQTGGSFDLLLDLGCGPGTVTRALGSSFQRAIGIDPSSSMIAQARQFVHTNLQAENSISFIQACGEDISSMPSLIPHESVDMISAGMAAHWLNLPRFWPAAGQVLRPGGSVAFWATPQAFCHPSTPYATEVQAIFRRLETEALAPYETEGNRLSRSYYDNLDLPWTSAQNGALSGGTGETGETGRYFSPDQFERIVFDRGGLGCGNDHFFLGETLVTLEQIAQNLSTMSMVTRWREANGCLAHSEKDVVVKAMRELREALHGGDTILTSRSCVLLLFKRI